MRTVQEELERALSQALGKKRRISGAARTDAGVHAEGQVCHFVRRQSPLRPRWTGSRASCAPACPRRSGSARRCSRTPRSTPARAPSASATATASAGAPGSGSRSRLLPSVPSRRVRSRRGRAAARPYAGLPNGKLRRARLEPRPRRARRPRRAARAPRPLLAVDPSPPRSAAHELAARRGRCVLRARGGSAGISQAPSAQPGRAPRGHRASASPSRTRSHGSPPARGPGWARARRRTA